MVRRPPANAVPPGPHVYPYKTMDEDIAAAVQRTRDRQTSAGGARGRRGARAPASCVPKGVPEESPAPIDTQGAPAG